MSDQNEVPDTEVSDEYVIDEEATINEIIAAREVLKQLNSRLPVMQRAVEKSLTERGRAYRILIKVVAVLAALSLLLGVLSVVLVVKLDHAQDKVFKVSCEDNNDTRTITKGVLTNNTHALVDPFLKNAAKGSKRYKEAIDFRDKNLNELKRLDPEDCTPPK